MCGHKVAREHDQHSCLQEADEAAQMILKVNVALLERLLPQCQLPVLQAPNGAFLARAQHTQDIQGIRATSAVNAGRSVLYRTQYDGSTSRHQSI